VAGLLTISKTSKIVNAILRAPLTPPNTGSLWSKGESARAGKNKYERLSGRNNPAFGKFSLAIGKQNVREPLECLL